MSISHQVLDGAFPDRKTLENRLKEIEGAGLNVVALGDITGPRMIVRKGPVNCEHQVIAVTGRDDDTLGKILRQRERDGWIACGIGPCGGATVMILKRALATQE
jgi:hypothetical protein